MPIDPRISLGVQPIQIENPLARYGQAQNILAAQAQMRGAETQQQAAQMQMAQTQRQIQQDEDYVTKMAEIIGKEGGPTDMMKAARIMAGNRNPQVSATGFQMLQSLQRIDEAKKRGVYGAIEPKISPVAPAPGALGSGTFDTGQPPMLSPRQFIDQPLPAQASYGVSTPVEPQAKATPSVMAAPPPAPVNQLAPAPVTPQANVNALRNEYIKLSEFSDLPGVKDRMDLIKAQLTEAGKLYTVGGNLVTGTGQSIFEAPEKVTQTDLRKNFEFAKTPEGGNYKGSFADFKAISTPKTTITMSTEKKYGEQFAGKMADRDDAKLGAAEKAPELAASANRIIDLVNQGNIFTGPIADVKLNIARVLNVAGASNDEKIANTESLIAATGQSTLDAIKSAGLGTGQGFTDKDLKFLQGVAGGTIDLTAQTLTRLATLQHQAATRSAEAWNKRAKQLPKSATEGTGLSLEPVTVPPLSAVKSAAPRPAGVGANWTFESDAAGNKAWVSPDRKSFKEAQ
jgi:hypothetical protein